MVRGALFAVFAALQPKCPLCVAAWMGALGLSGLAARVDSRALWLAGVTALTPLAAPLVTWVIIRSRPVAGRAWRPRRRQGHLDLIDVDHVIHAVALGDGGACWRPG